MVDLVTRGALGRMGVNLPSGAVNVTLPSSGIIATLAGTETLTNKTLTAPTINNAINGLSKRATAQTDVTSSTTLTNITGLSVPLTAGAAYAIHVYLPGTSNASYGVKFALGTSDTLTATSYSASARVMNSTSLVTDATITTFGSAIVASTSAFTYLIMDATLVVNAAGTLTAQIAQNVSGATATSAYVNGFMTITRIS